MKAFAEARKKGEVPNSSIFFLGRENYLASYGNVSQYTLGKAQVVVDTSADFAKSVTLLAVGPLLESACLAAETLKSKGMGAIVVHPSAINSLDMTTLKQCLTKTGGRCVSIEDHRVVGGFGSLFSHACAEEQIPVTMKSLGIKDHFGRSAYSSQELYDQFGLSLRDIVEAAESLNS